MINENDPKIDEPVETAPEEIKPPKARLGFLTSAWWEKLPDQVRARKLWKVVPTFVLPGLAVLVALKVFSYDLGLPPVVFSILLILFLCALPALVFRRWRLAEPTGPPLNLGPEVIVFSICGLAAFLLVLKVLTDPTQTPIAIQDKSIAILPFTNLGGGVDAESISDGFTEDVIRRLSKVGDMRVISPSSVMPYKRTQKTLAEIGQELGVGVILEGTFRRSADGVQVTGQLIDARTDRRFWSGTYDRDLEGLFKIQAELARQVARQLRVRLTADIQAVLEKGPTDNMEAYLQYLRGRDLLNRGTQADNDRAVQAFERALVFDPNYAQAHAGLAAAFTMRCFRFGLPATWLDQAVATAQKALALDSELAEGHEALGFALDAKGDLDGARRSYEEALKTNPNDGTLVFRLGNVYYALGRYDEALRWLRKACDLQPGVAQAYALVGLQYYNLGYEGPARVWLDRAITAQPNALYAHAALVYVDLVGGRTEQAIDRMEPLLKAYAEAPLVLEAAGDVKIVARDHQTARLFYEKIAEQPGASPMAQVKLAAVLLRLGERSRAEILLRQNLNLLLRNPLLDGNSRTAGLRYVLADIYALLNNKEEALTSLERAFARGFKDRWLTVDPLLDNVRGDARFRDLLTRYQAQIDEMRRRVEELGLDQ